MAARAAGQVAGQGAVAAAEVRIFASHSEVDELSRLLQQEANGRITTVQRLERRIEQLHREKLTAAAEIDDALHKEKQRSDRMNAEITSLGASLEGLKECLRRVLQGQTATLTECDGHQWFKQVAQKISLMDERQGVLDSRLRALRAECRELIAQESEQRVQGFQRLEREQRAFPHDAQQLAQRQDELAGLAASLQELQQQLYKTEARLLSQERNVAASWWDMALQRLGSVDERLAKVDGNATAQARVTEVVQLHVEELARAHNSFARTVRSSQHETESRLAALDAALGAVHSSFDKRFVELDEQLQGRAIAVNVIPPSGELARLENSIAQPAHDAKLALQLSFHLSIAVDALKQTLEERLRKIDEQAEAQPKAADAARSWFEELDQKYLFVASRLGVLDASFSSLVNEAARSKERANDISQLLVQCKGRFETLGARVEAHCASLWKDAEHAEPGHWWQSRNATETLLTSLLGELNSLRREFDVPSSPRSPRIVAKQESKRSAIVGGVFACMGTPGSCSGATVDDQCLGEQATQQDGMPAGLGVVRSHCQQVSQLGQSPREPVPTTFQPTCSFEGPVPGVPSTPAC